jgi:N-acetyl sugar amidotransferase
MDTSDPRIEFDADGVCNHCRGWEARAKKELPATEVEATARLNALVGRIRAAGQGRPYDCVIGVSGGVDSTAVAYHVKRLGLRPIAVHLDNGWNTELAVDNIQRTLEKLRIDLVTHVLDWEGFRDMQVAFLRASVPNCEIPTDHAITSLLYRTAAKIGVRYIISGGNLATEGILPLAWTYYNQDYRHVRAVHRLFGRRGIKNYPSLSVARWMWYVFGRRIRFVRLLNLVGYSKSAATALIQAELGWRPYPAKHYESLYTRFYQGYYLPLKFGFDKRRAHYSTLVMSGDMTRGEALAAMTRDPYADGDLRQDREYVLRKLGMSEPEFQSIVEAPNRAHGEFPSNRRIFEGMGTLRERFKRIATAE